MPAVSLVDAWKSKKMQSALLLAVLLITFGDKITFPTLICITVIGVVYLICQTLIDICGCVPTNSNNENEQQEG